MESVSSVKIFLETGQKMMTSLASLPKPQTQTTGTIDEELFRFGIEIYKQSC